MMYQNGISNVGRIALALVFVGFALARVGHAAEVTCDVKGGTLAGTLEMPVGGEGKGKPAVVVMVAGSGPTDRDGNNNMAGNNNCLRLLAEALKEAGIASVRYDKRGIGGSVKAATKEEDLRFENYADDAGAWIAWAKKDGRFGKVFVLGHSEGALLGILAAEKVDVDGVITVSGPGRPAQDVLREQLAKNLPEGSKKEASEIVDSLVAGKTVERVSPILSSLFRPSVQPYVISWFRYDPSKEIAKLKVPVLIVQGTTDIQVPATEAELLGKAAGDHGTVVMVKGMNHIMKKAEGNLAKQLEVYRDPRMAVMPEMVTAVVEFVGKK